MTDTEKNRQIDQDKKEEMTKALHEGRRLGVMALYIVAIIIMGISVVKGRRDNYEILALLLSYGSASAIPQFRATRKVSYLLASIICGLAAATCLGGYLYLIFR